jgi:FADH2 O2-dependent halogenase
VSQRFDFLIAGSGFSGSLLAWILASQGRSVLLIDRSRHPRFAVGESSTPTADFLLAYLAQRWNLPSLAPLACWGQWKKHYPHIVCGKKRGFSYYLHQPGASIDTHRLNTESLLVAASAQDAWSDTHWLRSSVDEFLANQAQAAGATLLESTHIDSAEFDSASHRWSLRLETNQRDSTQGIDIQATWLIDATGHHGLRSSSIDNPDDSAWMRTRTGAVYGHFEGVAPFDEAACQLDPFSGDDAAQHHVLESGWVWMLRFDNGITSVGLVEPASTPRSQETFWNTIERHPSLARLMQNAKLTAPQEARGTPNSNRPAMATAERMSRCRSKAWGPGWVCLPVSYGFIDPLHSTGIAHALSGVCRLAESLMLDQQRCYQSLQKYGLDLRRELQWLDLLVDGCYQGQPSFQNFVAFACMYFVSAIEFEKQLAADPSHWPKGFLQSQDTELSSVAGQAYQMLELSKTDSELSRGFAQQVRAWIEPWNRVGLLDPSISNRIAHSVAPKYASSVSSLCSGLK